MGTVIEAQATVAQDRPGRTALDLPADGSIGALPRAATPATRPGRGRRAVGAAALAAVVLGSTALLTRPAAAPVVARTPAAAPATLPAMPASMGFWDFVLPPAPALPDMPNDMGYWDRIR
jgi:hypothetical protein